MATKKSKKVEYVDGLDIPIATDAKAFKKNKEPKVVKGSHLTVTTFENGITKLEWDDEALLREVRDAILKYESTIPATKNKPAVKAKSVRKKKLA